MAITPVRCPTADLQLFAGDSRSETLRERRNRYEIIDGELFVTKSPHWDHQSSCANIGTVRREVLIRISGIFTFRNIVLFFRADLLSYGICATDKRR